MKSKLPKQIFVTIEDEGTEDQYFSAQAATINLMEPGESKTVGTYELKAVSKMECKSQVTIVPENTSKKRK